MAVKFSNTLQLAQAKTLRDYLEKEGVSKALQDPFIPPSVMSVHDGICAFEINLKIGDKNLDVYVSKDTLENCKINADEFVTKRVVDEIDKMVLNSTTKLRPDTYTYTNSTYYNDPVSTSIVSNPYSGYVTTSTTYDYNSTSIIHTSPSLTPGTGYVYTTSYPVMSDKAVPLTTEYLKDLMEKKELEYSKMMWDDLKYLEKQPFTAPPLTPLTSVDSAPKTDPSPQLELF